MLILKTFWTIEFSFLNIAGFEWSFLIIKRGYYWTGFFLFWNVGILLIVRDGLCQKYSFKDIIFKWSRSMIFLIVAWSITISWKRKLTYFNLTLTVLINWVAIGRRCNHFSISLWAFIIILNLWILLPLMDRFEGILRLNYVFGRLLMALFGRISILETVYIFDLL